MKATIEFTPEEVMAVLYQAALDKFRLNAEPGDKHAVDLNKYGSTTVTFEIDEKEVTPETPEP